MSNNAAEHQRPFMGRVDFDQNDPDLESKLRALEYKARLFGSNVVPLTYPGMPIQVYVGTNHNYQYDADDTVEKVTD